jgi:hypothetical protein
LEVTSVVIDVGLTEEGARLKVGCWYRIRVPGGGQIEGKVRSTKIPPGFRLNKDGEHSIWIAGNDVEWFLRPTEVETAEEYQVATAPQAAPAR